MWCLREYRFLWSHTTTTTTTTKSLQLCLTLCDPMDGSPPGSGILQARTLEWVAISFSNVWKWKVKVKLLSRVRPSATPWTAAFQAPLSMGFSRQKYWSGVPLPSPLWSHSNLLLVSALTFYSLCLFSSFIVTSHHTATGWILSYLSLISILSFCSPEIVLWLEVVSRYYCILNM